jgi:uncharacterized OB-fold protein
MAQLNDTLGVAREAAKPRSFSRPYWDGTREKRLLLQYDPRNARYQFFPRATSIHDGKRALEWREASGKGVVFSFTIAHRARPPFRGHEPFAIGLVTLDEGVNVMANLVNCAEEDLRIGMRVEATWAPLPDGTHLLMFQPAAVAK